MISHRSLLLALALSVAVLLSGCAGVQRPVPPDVQLAGLEMDEVTLSHANMMARLRLYNPNTFNLRIEGVRLQMHLNEVQLAKGSAVGPIDIPSQSSGDILVRVSSPLWSFFNLVSSLEGGRDITYRLGGDVYTGGWGIVRGSFPIEHKGVIPLEGTLPQE